VDGSSKAAARRTLALEAGEPEPEGKRARNKQQKRDRILKAARELFTADGFSATTIQDVATRAKVAAGTVFLYARSKEDLLIQALSGELEEAVAEMTATMPQDAPTVDRLMHIYAALIRYHAAIGREMSALMLRELMYGTEENRAGSNRAMQALDDLTAAAILDGQKTGQLRSRVEMRLVNDTLFSVFYWLLIHWSLGRIDGASLEAQVRERVELCVRGLSRPGAARKA